MPLVVRIGSLGDDDASASTFSSGCGWRFGGYTCPLLDPEINHLRESAFVAPGWTWTPELGYHAAAASTCTVFIRRLGVWRIYLPIPRLERDTAGDYFSILPELYVNTARYGTPDSHPAAPFHSFRADIDKNQRYPTESSPDVSVWYTKTVTERFLPYFMAFVDSHDGGFTFPIYAPKVRPILITSGADAGSVGSWDTANADWSSAGWTPTSIPSVTDSAAPVADANGLYVVYRDPSVMDLADEYDVVYEAAYGAVPSGPTGIGHYWMICLEHSHPWPAYEFDDPLLVANLGFVAAMNANPCSVAVESCTSANGRCYIPFTRIVLFLSDTPDFVALDSAGADSTWPTPGVSANAIPLVAPDVFSPSTDTPPGCSTSSSPTSEYYGVPEARLTPDRGTLIVFAPWNIGANPDIVVPVADLPDRVRSRYGSSGPAWTRSPVGAPGKGGISVFTFWVPDLLSLFARRLADGLSEAYVASEIERLRTYEGEVLCWDGTVSVVTLDTSEQFVQPGHTKAVDPHFGFHAGRLWQWLNRGTVIGTQEPYTLSRAYNVCVEDLLALRSEMAEIGVTGASEFQLEATQGRYTCFLLPSSCANVLDMRDVVYDRSQADVVLDDTGGTRTNPATGLPLTELDELDVGLVRDHEIVDLGNGVMRAVFFSAPEVVGTDTTRIKPALVQAIITSADPTDTTSLADLLIPR